MFSISALFFFFYVCRDIIGLCRDIAAPFGIYILCCSFFAIFHFGIPFELLLRHNFLMSRHNIVDYLYDRRDISFKCCGIPPTLH